MAMIQKLRDDYETKENEKNNIASSDYEINDYPQIAKNRITDKEFANRINEITACSIMIRGVNVEVHKNPPAGQKRLYVHIEGPSKQEVENTIREIRRVLEEAAGSMMEHGYSNPSGRYTVV